MVLSVWAELMRRTFGVDVLACPRCGGRLRLVALIERALMIQRILCTPRGPRRRNRAAPRMGAPLLKRIEDQSQDAHEFDAAC